MLKIVVYDSGFGGELFADYLEAELGVAEIIRAIDWRHADELLKGRKSARKVAEESLRPYIGQVNLIIFANHLLTATSLKYFRRKYRSQIFIGFRLVAPDSLDKRPTLILTTTAMSHTVNYYNFIFRLKCQTMTVLEDDWFAKIDDGELTQDEIKARLMKHTLNKGFIPKNLILAGSQFSDIKNELRKTLGHNIKIHDSFSLAYRDTCKILKIRGGNYRKKH